MSSKLKIQGNKIKVMDGFLKNDHVTLLLILLIIKYSTDGTTIAVPLQKIAFTLDAIKRGYQVANLSTLLSKPWDISDDLRKKIILLCEKKYIDIKEVNSILSFKMTESGNEIIQQIETLNIVPQVRKSTQTICKSIKLTELKKQNLIW